MKSRMTVRGMAMATGVAAAGALTITTTSFASELTSPNASAVTRTGDLPAGAAVRGPSLPASGKLALIQARDQRDRATDRGTAASLAAERYGWGAEQFSCLDSLWTRESGWSPGATNPSSGAYGIPQALPGSKMSAYGADWRTNATTQIEWGLAYIRDSYSTPCGAWDTFQAKGWY